MTTKSSLQMIGRIGTIQDGGLVYQVTIVDVKESYGRTRYLVTPVAGQGEDWRQNVSIEGGPP